MTPEDEEFLTELYRNLNKRPVPPGAREYVALEELPGQVMGPDAVKLLGRTVTMTTPGENFFLTGLRGARQYRAGHRAPGRGGRRVGPARRAERELVRSPKQ